MDFVCDFEFQLLILSFNPCFDGGFIEWTPLTTKPLGRLWAAFLLDNLT
jgi:hypothetical protein